MHYHSLSEAAVPRKTTFYYDPQIDIHHRLPVRAATASCFYSAPQTPEDSRRLFDAAVASAGFDRDPLPEFAERRGPAVALALAREWRLEALEVRLAEAIEARFEPTWDRERAEFTWGLGLGEPHPRGQYNAFLATAEAVAPGAWARLSEAPLAPCPQVVGVDFPRVALRRARWEGDALELDLDVPRPAPDERTRFEVHGVPPGQAYRATGARDASVERAAAGLQVTLPRHSGRLRIEPGP